MSWQAYIDTSLVGSGNVDSAAIFSVNGKDSWAHSANFKISADEMAELLKAFDDPNSAYANGLKINGEKYTVIQVLDNVLRTKKGKEGLVAAKTVQALIIAHHPESVLTNACSATVEQLAEYLKGVGY
ncbi:uncharacterized protein PV09_01222 [Verruconis gallopava]|uniref:Profilin n=1 Tax=Verruconis gallopava TaxID=253628 RepID=A0A0D2BAD7_9PEZI|nr:uncharacterized protein PV09_01222 [Verruconis gallopava]KIW08304.1 hypothetical protein PV09_01222 [Verruconis gallopava]